MLLNLPQHLRYLPENMYLAGIIPADKPSTEDIYPYLELVTQELLDFWIPGVMFLRTGRELHGRLFKVMLIPVVCDMLAVRQVIGLGSVASHNFAHAAISTLMISMYSTGKNGLQRISLIFITLPIFGETQKARNAESNYSWHLEYDGPLFTISHIGIPYYIPWSILCTH